MTEEIIMHFGVKGMKWGVRGTARYQKAYDKEVHSLKGRAAKYNSKAPQMSKIELKTARDNAQRRINKLDMNSVVAGLGYSAKKSSSVSKKAQQIGEKTPYQKLTPQEKRNIAILDANKNRNITIAKGLSRTAVEAGVLIVGGTALMKVSGFNPKLVAQGQAALGGLILTTGGMTVGPQFKAVVDAAKYTRLSELRDEYDRELDKRN